MIDCGRQCIVCDYPVHFDTYIGCSHGCKYCYVREHSHNVLQNIYPHERLTDRRLRAFINGKRTLMTKAFDWRVPLHWGSQSDPFQPAEKTFGRSIDCLKIFCETQYPFIVSTKSILPSMKPYSDLFSKCRCVLQFSMACPEYDSMEPGAPKYEERLRAAEILSERVPRVIARVQPYFPKYRDAIIAELPGMARAGIYGIIVESYVTKVKHDDMEKDGTRYMYPLPVLAEDYKIIRAACHAAGMRFFCGEDRLRSMGDSLTCCGTEGLEDFVPATYNIEHLAHAPDTTGPTMAMQSPGSGEPFKGLRLNGDWYRHVCGKTYSEMMLEIGEDYICWYRELAQKYD